MAGGHGRHQQDSKARFSLGSKDDSRWRSEMVFTDHPSPMTATHRKVEVAPWQTAATTQLPQLGLDFWLGHSLIKQCPKPMGGMNKHKHKHKALIAGRLCDGCEMLTDRLTHILSSLYWFKKKTKKAISDEGDGRF